MRAFTLLLCLPMGCSIGNLDVVECTTDSACRDLFGLGSTCGAEGFCSEGGLHARCSTIPEDLFDSPEAHADTIVLGHLWRNQSFDTEQRAVQLSVLHANDNEGLDGTRYGLVSCDTEEHEGDSLQGEEATAAMAEYLAVDLGARECSGRACSFGVLVSVGTERQFGVLGESSGNDVRLEPGESMAGEMPTHPAGGVRGDHADEVPHPK